MQPGSQLTISVIVPVHNGGESFRQCLSSIQSSIRLPDEVIVVADGDTDGSWQVAEAFEAKVIRLLTSHGPAQARNIGAQSAQGDILFFVDADVTLHPNTISLVEQEFLQDAELSALIGSYDDEPGAANFLSQYKNLFHHYTHQTALEVASTFWGACGAIRRSVFLSVGGFDRRYRRPCIEDIELGYRLKRLGYRIRLCKTIQVKHLKQWQLVSLLRAEIFYRALPWAELILRDRQLTNDLNLSSSNRLSVILTFLLIGCLAAGCWMPQLLKMAMGCGLSLLLINRPVYQFFYCKRGFLFTLRVIPWHWLYFLYGGAAFAYGMFNYYLRQWLSPKAGGSVVPRRLH